MRADFTISPSLAEHVTGAFREAGRTWLAGLPVLLAACAGRWSLTIGAPLPGLSYSYVAPARQPDGSALILKLGVPNSELSSEIAALRGFAGRGAVRLLDADPEQGVLLLEWLQPGTPLAALADDGEAVDIAAGVLGRLWRPVPAGAAVIAQASWVGGLAKLRQRYGGGTGPLPARPVGQAQGLFRDLLASMPPAQLLHGDLHFGNILAAQREPWLAIDPKGVSGDPAYDAAVMLLDLTGRRLAAGEQRRLFDRRAGRLSELLGLDRRRLLRWAFAHVVLSAWWTIEDGGQDWQTGLARADALAGLLD